MASIPDIYYLESIEQMRALSGDLRQRIVARLGAEPMTVTQLGAALGLAPAKVHYHVRELERVGLVRLVETREKGGILEKYYRAVAGSFLVTNDVLQRTTPDELIATSHDLVQSIAQSFITALSRAVRRPPLRHALTIEWDQEQQSATPASQPSGLESNALASQYVWLTGDEFKQIGARIYDLLRPYETRRDIPGERQYTAVQMLFETPPPAEAEEDEAAASVVLPVAPTIPAQPRRGHVVVIGVTQYSRKALEQIVNEGKVLDITVLGVCAFDDDVSPDLADQAIGRFRHHGALHASPAVRDVLQRKAQPARR